MKRFMSKLKDRQTLLKVVLLLALVGNVSFEPIKRRIQETNLSQSAPPVDVDVQQELAPAPAVEAKTAVEKKPEEKAKPVEPKADLETRFKRIETNLSKLASTLQEKRNAEGRAEGTVPLTTALTDKSVQKITPPKPETPEVESALEVCSDTRKARTLTVKYTERVDANGKVRTSASARNSSKIHRAEIDGNREDNQEKIEESIKIAAEKLLSCPHKKTAEERRQEAADKKEKEDLEEKVASCEFRKVTETDGTVAYVDYMSSEGKESLSTEELRKEHLQCQVDHLSKGFYHDTKASKSKILKAAEKIVNKNLRGEIKRMVNSSDNETADEGTELASQVIDELELLKDARDFSSSEEKKIDKLIHGMQGIRAGGDLARRSREYKDEAKGIKDDYRSAYKAWKADPLDPFKQSEVYSLERAHQNLQDDILKDRIFGKSISNFADLNRRHYLEPEEVRLFSNPYNDLRYELDLYGALGSRGDSLGGLSDGLFSEMFEARSGRVAQRRWNGFDPYPVDRSGLSGLERYGIRSAFDNNGGGRNFLDGNRSTFGESSFGGRDSDIFNRYDSRLPVSNFGRDNGFGRGNFGNRFGDDIGLGRRNPSTSFGGRSGIGLPRLDNGNGSFNRGSRPGF